MKQYIVPAHGWVMGDPEEEALIRVAKRRWYTAGEECKGFARGLRELTGRRRAILCNSGSSANLLALSALTDRRFGTRAIRPGDEVITTALGFPTTMAAIFHAGAVPVCVDVTLPGMAADVQQIEAAISNRTRAVFLAHTLGYPFDVARVREICDAYHLWLVEDGCDALGTPEAFTLADLSTCSFYPAHQIATAEGGGAVLFDSGILERPLLSFRDWGRACWCPPGQDNTCGTRFADGRDHKYTYDQIGYNLQMGEFQAAMGRVQLERFPDLLAARQRNHQYLLHQLKAGGAERVFILPPDDPSVSWFGFALLCRDMEQRNPLERFLDERGVQTRRIFGGNLLAQPAFEHSDALAYFPPIQTDFIDEAGLWVGCWPGLTQANLDYLLACLSEFISEVP